MSGSLESGKRLTLSEIVLHLLQRSGNERSSVALSRNAKGVTQIDVTVRTGDTEGITSALDAEREATAIYDRLRRQYPLPSGMTGAEGGPGEGEAS